MKHFFVYIEKFKFKDFLSLLLLYKLLDMLASEPSLRDMLIVILTLIVKHYYDNNSAAAKKDETISKALTHAQGTKKPGDPAINSVTDSNVNITQPE